MNAIDNSLLALRREYDHAQAIPRFSADGVCRYCGKRWRAMPGATINGHAICAVTPEFRELLHGLTRRDPGLTYDRLAATFGVSTFVVRLWLNAAMKAEGLQTGRGR